jgi:hypothetical protein
MLTMSEILKVLLTIHIVGLAISGGGAITNYFNVKRAWKFYSVVNPNVNVSHLDFVVTSFSGARLVWIGLGLSIISGAAMMHMAYSAFMDQIWFQLKMLAVLIILIIEVVKAVYVRKVRKIMTAKAESNVEIAALKGKINLFSLIQLLSFFLIFILAVFRFDR